MDVVLLGSTGSIGTQTLDVCRMHNIKVKALSANCSVELLETQAREFLPEYIAVSDEKYYHDIKTRLSDLNVKILCGDESVCELAALKCGRVVNAVVGFAGLLPTLSAFRAKNSVALANKETLVAGGELVMKALEENGASLLLIDSEHSAIFQCLLGAGGNKFSKIILTASGGPFFGKHRDELKNVTKAQALNHPNWNMGAKITVDSATMMNKGLELIEAVHYFKADPDQVEIVIHRQSVVHSAVEFEDGAIIAQLGTADMRIPIQLALTYPKRLHCPAKRLSLTEAGKLTFEKPDDDTFCCLKAAKSAIKMGGNAPCIVNCANEAAVSLFLNDKIGFLDIGEAVNAALNDVKFISNPSLDDILDTKNASEDYVFSRFKQGEI
ncbi:MAG: 1-deoxy-D-xylulose-5-phosphate reductoisomerase [Oscillospiraceae bacterium]|nr:1-deoxy-D-xylulose-5-phosphate reductoisomerase [Oscillospiraceae bacterium]